jgi:uracil phosphoribosyltransferase
VPQTAPNLHVSQHPAVLHKLAILRDEKTEPKKFREVVRELSWLLGYEALADVRVKPLEIRTPLETMTAHELGERVGFVPILRAGLGMVRPPRSGISGCSVTSERSDRSSTTTSCPTRRPSTCA